ncbi:hypothetical protein QFC22_000528 [Naganishia vaughanmartiniae]|uniref:Uncharacterized protein n=1 Tax=Naganishia vaughanmartiniae TaxID=1424756 RepID=A0ACC2XQB2_9TREE|nr:hypothetical protein QFC22_000528 [Naganishia vaughanmartiniae]
MATLLDPSSKLVGALVWTLVDFIAARALQSIWISRKEAEEDVLRNAASAGLDTSIGRRKWLREDWKDHVMSLYV